jgi:uncharacterized protein (DUF2252 family)
MMASPFTFFRGAAAVMAADIAALPRTSLWVQLCGDAHLSNFGVYAAPDRALVFDINDFDETLPGPWEWDVFRLAASLEIAGRDRGFRPDTRREAVTSCVCRYRDALREFATLRHMEVWYARLDPDAYFRELERQTSRVGTRGGKDYQSRVQRTLAKAEAKNHLRAFSRLTRIVDGSPQIMSDPPLIVPLRELVTDGQLEQTEEAVRTLFRDYRDSLQSDRRHLLETFQLMDLARKVVGVGSVGTRAWIALALGRDDNDPIFLQIKEAGASVVEPHAGASIYANHGERVVAGQRLMQATSDIMLGWTRVKGIDGVVRDYYVRQLWDGKGSARIATMEPGLFDVYARMCGWTLARAHARSGDRVALASYLGRGDAVPESMAQFASRYADKNERDYEAFAAAIKAGRLAAQEGV